MSSPDNIQYLLHKDIDKIKWDACIDKAENSLIYAYSFYLDHMAIRWDAMVLNEYEAVMPVIWNKKYGIKYFYQPPFIQQLGVFGNIKDESLKALFKKLSSFLRYGDLMLNYQNKFISLLYPARQMTNFIINLENDYNTIYSRYTKELHDTLKRAEKQVMVYTTCNDIDNTIELYRLHYAGRTPHVKAKDYENFNRLCHQPGQNCECLIKEVKNVSGDLLASALLLKDKRRIYNMINIITDSGKKTEATRFLLDNIIREFSGQPLLFDFEGSELPGTKRIYETFGPLIQPYYHWHYNNLPFYIKWLKK